jgi:hypothetical protein
VFWGGGCCSSNSGGVLLFRGRFSSRKRTLRPKQHLVKTDLEKSFKSCIIQLEFGLLKAQKTCVILFGLFAFDGGFPLPEVCKLRAISLQISYNQLFFFEKNMNKEEEQCK